MIPSVSIKLNASIRAEKKMHKIYVKSNQIENSHLSGENGQLCAQFSVKSDSIIYIFFAFK